GNPDIVNVIYITSRLVHCPACLLAWSVIDSIPADAMAASARPWCPDLAPSPLARRREMLAREWRNGPLYVRGESSRGAHACARAEVKARSWLGIFACHDLASSQLSLAAACSAPSPPCPSRRPPGPPRHPRRSPARRRPPTWRSSTTSSNR